MAFSPVILFCSDPLESHEADHAFSREATAARKLGLVYELIDFEALVLDHDCVRAVRRVKPRQEPTAAIYRGWMLKPDQYAELHESLSAKNVRLINNPAAYRHCHHLPESYAVIESHTPRSVWMKLTGELSMEVVMELLRPFGSAAVIVKDFVKSRKHEWNEACFIPSASDRGAVEAVVRRFLDLQDEDLNEGLVFREFVEFEPLATHSKSGMPLTREFRLFYLDGRPLLSARYWDEGDYGGIVPPLDCFAGVAAQIRSRFFSMDIAQRHDEKGWMIVELGDGQVAGLPETVDAGSFVAMLTRAGIT